MRMNGDGYPYSHTKPDVIGVALYSKYHHQ